jgi:hypothetical protein
LLRLVDFFEWIEGYQLVKEETPFFDQFNKFPIFDQLSHLFILVDILGATRYLWNSLTDTYI